MTVNPQISSSEKDLVRRRVPLEGRSTRMMPAAPIGVALPGRRSGCARWMIGDGEVSGVPSGPPTRQHSSPPSQGGPGTEERLEQEPSRRPHANNSCSSSSDKIWERFRGNILCFSDSFSCSLQGASPGFPSRCSGSSVNKSATIKTSRSPPLRPPGAGLAHTAWKWGPTQAVLASCWSDPETARGAECPSPFSFKDLPRSSSTRHPLAGP